MSSKLPILVIIPHGGYNIPDELSDYAVVDKFELFMNADTCANEIYDFSDRVSAYMNTYISRLFIDLDRNFTDLPPSNPDGVIKKKTMNKRNVFPEKIFPDEIAISNILNRYYFPFHDTIEKIMTTGQIKLILECHTMPAIGPAISSDPGSPRPIFSIENMISSKDRIVSTCSDNLASDLINRLKKSFTRESETVTGKIKLNHRKIKGHILEKYGTKKIPMLRISLSRSLFLNERYFSYDYMRVDELRIRRIRLSIWEAVEKFFKKNF